MIMLIIFLIMIFGIGLILYIVELGMVDVV